MSEDAVPLASLLQQQPAPDVPLSSLPGWKGPVLSGLIAALGIPKQLIQQADTALHPYTSGVAATDIDPRANLAEMATQTAMGMMGATGAVAPAQSGSVLGSGPIKAFHGSPHDFESFDLSKIGTGEGAQAYGHGLYFAENPATAEAYREALKDQAGSRVGGVPTDPANPEHLASAYLAQYKTPQAAIEQLDQSIGQSGMFALPREQIVAAQQAKSIIASGKPLPDYTSNPGKMYEVNINADPEHFLDWDKPLSEQHPAVQQKLKDAWLAHPEDHAHQTGEEIYRQAEISLHQPGQGHLDRAVASQTLKDAGIPGIKYLDQGSRGAGNGTSNYVVFNDKLIDIMRKYGMIGAIPAAGAGASQFLSPPQLGGQQQ